EWVEPELIQASVPAGLSYRRFNFNEELPSVVGSGTYLGTGGCEFYCIGFEDSDIDTDETLKVGSRVASIPRPGRFQSGGTEVYQKEVKQLLKDNGIDAEPLLKQVVRADLDGDGAEEVIVVATNADATIPEFKENTYSLVLFRKLVDGKVVTTPLYQHYYHEDISGQADSPSGYMVTHVVDIDGDGKMEVLLNGRYYEGIWYEVYKLENHGLKKVLSAGIGS
ncbi:MAG: FG-GAP repeat domain-containing protein, partial [Candidatus Rifleibacteriota bacterium]